MARQGRPQRGPQEEKPQRKRSRVSDYPLDTQWLLTDPDVQALTWEEMGILLRVIAVSHNTPTPGIMTEEQIRVWAKLTVDEWARVRGSLLKLFRALPDTRLVLVEMRRVCREQQTRLARARKASAHANRERWRKGEAAASMVVQAPARRSGKPAEAPAAAEAQAGTAGPAPAHTGTNHAAALEEGRNVAALVAGVTSRLHMRSGP